MNNRRKPNYKLRRTIAKIVIVLLIVIPIFLYNKTKLLNLTVYIPNMKYSSVVDSFFEIGYSKEEVINTMDYLKKKKKITDDTDDYILKLNSKGYGKNTIDYFISKIIFK